MADRRRSRPLSRYDLPLGGFHAAEDDVSARENRLLAVLHLFHLAQHQAELTDYFDRATTTDAGGLFPSALLRQYAGHQSVFPADLRACRISHSRGAGGDTFRTMGNVFRASSFARRRRCRAARNISIRRNTRSASATSNAPGNIIAEIARLNRIRKAHPALQSHLGLTLLHCL